MKFRNGLLFFLFLSLTIVSMLGSSGCANIVPPLGGPRDTLPPRLITVVPRDNSLNFVINKDIKNNKIVFNFDEYIDPKDVRTELIISPVPKLEPIVDAKLRTLTVRLKDTLQPNTTYSLDFGKAIRDINEGNILKNFTYTFSTGKYLDSMEFTGNVTVAETGKVDSTLIVILHKSLDDSAVVKDRPRYMTRVDTTGRFRFRHLEPGTYAVYAMKDEGGTRRYISKGQLFGFADSPVVIHQGTSPVSLYVFTEKADVKPPSKSGTASKPGQTAKPDKEKEKDKRLQFQTNISNGEFDVLDTLRMLFPNPLQDFEASRIRFTDEHYKDISERDYHFERDTSYKKYSLFYNWPTNTKFHLILAKDFAQDSAGRKLLKIDTLSFHTKKDIEYGEVRVRITNLDLSRNPVLLMIQQDAVKFSYAFKGSKEFRKTLFAPGEYELRILYDANKNGIWDSGEFFGKHLQPEKVVPIRKKLTVKANWDNDWDYTL